MVLDVAQLEALLARTFSIGLDVGRDTEKVALVRLWLSRALLGAAGTQAMAAEALAIEQGVATEQMPPYLQAASSVIVRPPDLQRWPDYVYLVAVRK